MARPFEGSPHVRPRRWFEYSDTEGLGVAPARLPRMSARGLYVIHLTYCNWCLVAEARGTYYAECPHKIHVWAAVVEGFWIPWRGGSPPDVTDPVVRTQLVRRISTPRYNLNDADPRKASEAREVEGQLEDLRHLGVLRTLTPEEAADPRRCASICQVMIDVKEKPAVPAELLEDTAAKGGKYDMALLARLAKQAGDADAAQYAAETQAQRDSGLYANSYSIRRGIMARRNESSPKLRLVVRHDQTLNPFIEPTSLEYETIADFGASLLPDSTSLVIDGSKAYYQNPPAADVQPFLVIQDPVTLQLDYLQGGPMGMSSQPLAASGPMAILRCALGASPAAQRGEATATGYLDDTAQSIANRALQEQLDWTSRILRVLSFLINDKRQQAAVVDYLGAEVDSRSRTAIVRLRKMFQIVYRWAFALHLCERSRPESNPPAGYRAFVDRDMMASIAGDTAWLGQFDMPTRLRKAAFYVSHSYAEERGLDVLLRSNAEDERTNSIWLTAR